MNDSQNGLLEIFQYFNYIAGYLASFAAIFGLRQLFIMKKDIAIRNERSAKEKAIEFANEYLVEFTKLWDIHFKEAEKNNIQSYKGPIGDFTPSSIPKEYRDNLKKRNEHTCWLNSLNKLESIAAAFVTGVADESTGYRIIGRSFCVAVSTLYDVISSLRKENITPYWNSIVELYKIWSSRITKEELANERCLLERRMADITDKCIRPIGND